jgi:multiple sugar transport system permease protein
VVQSPVISERPAAVDERRVASDAPPVPLARPRPRRSRRRTRRAFFFYLFVAPWLVGFLCLGLVPILLGLAMSFTNYDGFNLDTFSWVGFDNYTRAFDDPEAWAAFKRTVAVLVVTVPGAVALQLFLALLLHQAIRARGLFRTLFYLPSILPVVAAAWVWKAVGAPEGPLNELGARLGAAEIPWLVDHSTDLLRMWLLWAWSGAGMLIFLAALQGIPDELREAAAIDGATRAQTARRIVLPLLTPVIFFQLVMTSFLAFQVLVEPILLAPGLTGLANPPPPENNLFAVNAYQQIFVGQRFGYGAALLWLLFAATLLATLALFATARFWVFYDRPTVRRRP